MRQNPPSVYARERIVSRDCEWIDPDVEDAETCSWSGEVDAYIEDDGLYWTCPKCGHQHEEDAWADAVDWDEDR